MEKICCRYFVQASRIFIANFTGITPNQINFLTLILSVFQFYFFLKGNLILGAIFNQLSFGFDQIDGKIARLKKIVTKQGTLTDGLCDKLRVFLGVLGLTFYFQQNLLFVVLLLTFLFTNLMYDFIGLFLLYRVHHVFNDKLVINNNKPSKSQQISFSTQEQEALVFFFAPLSYYFNTSLIYYFIGLAVILMLVYLTLRVIKAIKRYHVHKA